ncbi:MAG: PilZ domain-containing protein [Acidobacteriota bacterium]
MTDTRLERRRNRREAWPAEHRTIRARIRPGCDISIVEVSAGGVLVESERRLLPGSSVDLQLRCADRNEIVRGRIVRCEVARVRANAICYRGAIAFDHNLGWLVDEAVLGYTVPGTETPPIPVVRAGSTQELR